MRAHAHRKTEGKQSHDSQESLMNNTKPPQRQAYRVTPSLDGSGYSIVNRNALVVCICNTGAAHGDEDYERAVYLCRCLNELATHYPTLHE
jgi:hypothetical protein